MRGGKETHVQLPTLTLPPKRLSRSALYNLRDTCIANIVYNMRKLLIPVLAFHPNPSQTLTATSLEAPYAGCSCPLVGLFGQLTQAKLLHSCCRALLVRRCCEICEVLPVRRAGVVNAVEVVHAFDGDDGLIAFRRWVLSPDTEGIASAAAAGGRGRGRGGRCERRTFTAQ